MTEQSDIRCQSDTPATTAKCQIELDHRVMLAEASMALMSDDASHAQVGTWEWNIPFETGGVKHYVVVRVVFR